MASDLSVLVLSKVVNSAAEKAAREGLSAGVYPVDFTVTVKGEVSVRPDTEKVPTVSIPIKETLALFIARSGALRDANIALLSECIADALAAKGGEGGAKGALTGEFDAAFGEVVSNFLATLPKTKVKGAVDCKALAVTITE
jgi:hypothetical protein